MKKPKIDEMFTVEGYTLPKVEGVNTKEAYEDMIDSLAEAYDYIAETAPDDIWPEQLLDKLEQALEKAGCKF